MYSLPAGFLYAGDEAVGGHFAELDTAEAECPHISLGATGEGAAVVETDRRRILGELVEGCPVAGFLQSLPLLSVFSNKFRTLYLAGFH